MGQTNITNYPFLTPEEFVATCHHLDRRYCQATLGPLRKQWRLQLCTALDTTLSFNGTYATYIQIVRPLEEVDENVDLLSRLAAFSMSTGETDAGLPSADNDMIMSEQSDQAILPRLKAGARVPHVEYEIHLHTTYRVPCLWFTLHDLPPDEPSFNIDTVFRRLVPDEYKSALRGMGHIGGVSADHHPVTGVPAFFVHPCMVGDAMAGFDCSTESYLNIWLGLVGGCVGLWLPKGMMVSAPA